MYLKIAWENMLPVKVEIMKESKNFYFIACKDFILKISKKTKKTWQITSQVGLITKVEYNDFQKGEPLNFLEITN